MLLSYIISVLAIILFIYVGIGYFNDKKLLINGDNLYSTDGLCVILCFVVPLFNLALFALGLIVLPWILLVYFLPMLKKKYCNKRKEVFD